MTEAEDGISVVLPAYNVEGIISDTIGKLREELRPLARPLEFIAVDDGSTDGTVAVVTQLCQTASDVRLLRNQRNLGKGLTVYLGCLAARYAKVCFTDADLPFSGDSYVRVLRQFLRGHPFTVASRRMADSEILVRMDVLGYAARRHVVGVAFNTLVRVALRLPFRDTQCGLKAFDRQVGIELLRRVRSARFLFDIELFLAARHLGVSVEEVPVRMVYHDFKSSVKLAAESSRMLTGLVAMWVRDQLGHYASPDPKMAPDLVRGWTQEVFVCDAKLPAATPSSAVVT